MADLFGFEIKRKGEDKEEAKKRSFVAPMEDDGSGVIKAGGHYGQYLDMSGGNAKNEGDLISKYREISQIPEVDAAIEDIINESIVSVEDGAPVDINLNGLEQPDRIKKIIRDEFEKLVAKMSFS
jgi:hypothetical protein